MISEHFLHFTGVCLSASVHFSKSSAADDPMDTEVVHRQLLDKSTLNEFITKDKKLFFIKLTQKIRDMDVHRSIDKMHALNISKCLCIHFKKYSATIKANMDNAKWTKERITNRDIRGPVKLEFILIALISALVFGYAKLTALYK